LLAYALLKESNEYEMVYLSDVENFNLVCRYVEVKSRLLVAEFFLAVITLPAIISFDCR